MLPTRILSNEFDILMKEIQENLDIYNDYIVFKHAEKAIETENLVKFCYNLDENEVPHRYRLLSISRIIPDYKNGVFIHYSFFCNCLFKIIFINKVRLKNLE